MVPGTIKDIKITISPLKLIQVVWKEKVKARKNKENILTTIKLNSKTGQKGCILSQIQLNTWRQLDPKCGKIE